MTKEEKQRYKYNHAKSTMDTWEFTKWRVGRDVRMSDCLRDSLEIREWREEAVKESIINMNAFVYKNQMKKEVCVMTCPKDWIEAVKERWAPRWFLRKYPVKFREEKIWIEHVAVFPDANIRFPDQMGNPVFKILTVRSDSPSWEL